MKDFSTSLKEVFNKEIKEINESLKPLDQYEDDDKKDLVVNILNFISKDKIKNWDVYWIALKSDNPILGDNFGDSFGRLFEFNKENPVTFNMLSKEYQSKNEVREK